MCGIAGATGEGDQEAVARAMAGLGHRGPDGAGLWFDPASGTGLGVARLATTDISDAARQPVVSGDGRFVLAFNGYVAGHRRLLAAIRERGKAPNSQSDAELVLSVLTDSVLSSGNLTGNLIGELARLSGQYALAFFDAKTNCLWLARDPMGIKPLYVMDRADGQIAFASELSALTPFGALVPDLDVQAQYRAHLFPPAPATGFENVRQVQPGEVVTWQAGTKNIDQIPGPDQFPMRPDDPVTAVRRAVRQSVADAMDADRSVGTLLSGGLDSAGVAAFACDIAGEYGHAKPPGFVMSFAGHAMDETAVTQAVAKHLGMALHVVEAPEDPEEILTRLRAGLTAMGSPFANPSIVLMHALSEAVSDHVPICLAGDGGDELFGGYPRYRAAGFYQQYWRHVPSFLRKAVARSVGVSGLSDMSRGVARFVVGGQGTADQAFDFWNDRWGLLAGVSRLRDDASVQSSDLVARMMAFDRDVTLPGNQLAMSDRCGMAFGVEYRLPLLGHAVVRIAAGQAGSRHVRGGGKDLWRQAVEPLLPAGHVRQRKVGFNPPVADWLAKVAGLLWGDEARIADALMGDLPMAREKRIAYWRRARSLRAPDVTLGLWGQLVWRIWTEEIAPELATKADRKVGQVAECLSSKRRERR